MEAVGIWQGAQGQGRMDSQVAGGQSPPSPTSEGRHAISMLEPTCCVRVAAACTQEPGDMVLQYCLYICSFMQRDQICSEL
jgi:hypothetical protein